MLYTIRCSPDPHGHSYRYLVLRHERLGGTPEYVSDWPTLEAAKAAVARLNNPEPEVKQDPWRDA